MARRRVLFSALAGTAAVIAVIGVSVVWPGLDAQRTPPTDTSVWALQTTGGNRYARVNTAIDELDTVRSVSNPTSIAQSEDGAYLFSESFGRVTRIDESQPIDLDEDALRDSSTSPSGTVEVATQGDFVAYRTDSGAVFAGRLSDGEPAKLDPYAEGDDDDDTPEYTAEAIAVDGDGLLYSYSSVDDAVLRYRIPGARVEGRDPVSEGPEGENVEISAASGEWVMIDTADRLVWREGTEVPATIDLVGAAAIARVSIDGDGVYVADEAGMIRVPLDDAPPARVTGGADDYGQPARPVVLDGSAYGAWLDQTGGRLWRDGEGETPLDYGTQELSDIRRPVFSFSGSTMILNETRSGWVWSMPDGRLVPSSQDWSLDDRTTVETAPSDEESKVVIDPKPPVAEADAFGVRAGALVSLPVLLNDHDPNDDVLSIDPTSVTGLDPAFGSVTITDSGGRLAVQVAPDASGSATLSYRVTDGTGQDGLYSEVTSVTVGTVPEERNSAPEWCGTDGCLAEWPAPEVAPGGTVTVPALTGWVDPEGDPVMLLSVDNVSGTGAVASTPSGDVVYQHPDASDTSAQTVELLVTVADTHGAAATRPLYVQVLPEPEVTAESFTVIDTESGGLTVDVAPHVTGTAGTLTLSSVRVLDDAQAEAVADAGGTNFDFTADGPGTYRVSYTVTSGEAEDTAIARITILPRDAPAQLATAPVIAFVHPKEDATIDVFTAVSNPTRRVLLLSDVSAEVAPGASLQVDEVAQNFIRVTGTTATGEPGPLGTVHYTVSDGTDDAGSRITGQATVYLLPTALELAPIAVDDAVVVRVGAQVDIPVLENDVAPSGSAITLNPASVSSFADDALAFASGDLLRYLAPSEPGEHRIEYSIFSSGSPSLADTATVRVTVIPDDSNRPPRPETLEGRVLSGQATVIPLRAFGVDPDGDSVKLDRIVTQPQVGSATISADGDAIVYTSAPGDRGQRDFTYRVMDGVGATGVGTVRVGVLDRQSNPSPVTFTDYVQVQVGSDNAVRVSPLANDIDPTGGRLSLSAVRPDLTQSLEDGSPNPLYERLEGLLGTPDDGTIEIAAGATPGTMSFLYDVESASGNTGRGLIVVKVVRESVPDYPVVADTVLTAETRDRLPRGIDVLADKVVWTGGDVDDLTLALWGEPDGFAVAGGRLRGELPDGARIIPFVVSGEARDGTAVSTYAFLRIPAEDDLTLALRAGPAQLVTEGASVTFDMDELVTIPPGATLQVGEAIRSSGSRASGACVLAGGTSVRYDAGQGAPWADACTVQVRLSGQEDWTYLSVPVRIRAVEPQPELRPASIVLTPGETLTFDLRGMTTWQSKVDWDRIEYSLEFAGSAFAATLAGDIVTVTAADRATPGLEEAAIVGVTSHTGVDAVRLIFRVGPSPSLLPQGGTVAQQCTQAAGSSCEIEVIGADGEVNPLPRTPLELVAVRPTGACVGVAFTTVSASTVLASWSADAPGATCTAAFTVRDAQGRVTSGDREGLLLLDLQGYPKAPAALIQTRYNDGIVTLRVDPGEARQAYPALQGFTVRHAGAVVATCTPDGVCPDIAAPNGEARLYEAVAVNALGESAGRATTTAWAYDPPPPPSGVSANPVVTGGEGGLVSVRVTGLDTSETGFVELKSPLGETLQVRVGPGDETLDISRYRIGSNTLGPLTVTPFSRFALPPGLSGSESGAAVTINTNGIGAPVSPRLSLSATSDGDGTGTATVSAVGDAASGGDGSETRLGIAQAGQSCTATSGGGARTFPGLADGQVYTFQLCAESWRGGTLYGTTTVTAEVRAVQSSTPPRGYTFRVDATPDVAGAEARWMIRAAPTSTEVPPRFNTVEFLGGPTTSVYDVDPGMQVRYVHPQWGPTTGYAPVVAAAGSAPYQVWSRWRVATCTGGSPLVAAGESSVDPAGGGAAFSFDTTTARYYDADGLPLAADPATGFVPVGAVRVDGIGVTVGWGAQGWGLSNASTTFGGTCVPNDQSPAGSTP